MPILPRFVHLLIHPITFESFADRLAQGWNRQLTRIHPDSHLMRRGIEDSRSRRQIESGTSGGLG